MELPNLLAKAIGTDDVALIKDALETPPNLDMGDYAFPCFRLSKEMKRPAQQNRNRFA